MQTILVQRTLRAPIARVFDVLSDHAGYVSFPGVRRAALVKRGDAEPNGVGAVREIDTGLAWFREEVTAFQRPTRMEYVIVASRPPMRHRGGIVRLRDLGDGLTEVEWTSTFAVDLPLISGLATRLAARAMTRAFAETLRAVEARAAG
jgi:uncharacterized protein YndB with AHSA1/START domain